MTAYNYNIGKQIKLKDGTIGNVIGASQHDYRVQLVDRIVKVWGFNIKDDRAEILEEN